MDGSRSPKAYKVHSTTLRQRSEKGSKGDLDGRYAVRFPCVLFRGLQSSHLTFFTKERNRQCRLTFRREVHHHLLVTLWMLFTPQYQKQWRHFRENHASPSDFGVAARAQRDHQVQF